MASFSETSTSYKIRFYNSRRTPAEKAVYLSKSDWTKREAKRYKRELVVQYERGEYDPWRDVLPGRENEALGLRSAVNTYVDAKTAAGQRGEHGGWTERTRAGTESVLLDFARQAGSNKRLSDVTTSDLSAFIHQPGLAHASKRSYRKVLKAMFRWFEQHLDAPAPAIPPPLEARKRLPATVTEGELHAICDKHRELALESFARNDDSEAEANRLWMIDLYWWRFWLGQRPAEAIAQRVGGVDLGRNLVVIGDATFVSKNKSEATIPLVKPARPLARKLCEGRKPTERLFRHTSFKKASDAFREAVRKALPNAGRMPFYNLRHSCGAYWRRRGVPLSTIQELLRHANPKTTMIYSQIEPLDVGRIFDQAYDAFESMD